MSPFPADAQHSLEVALLEPRTGHIAIAIVAVGMGGLIGVMPVPDKTADIASKTYNVFPQSLIRLILAAHVHLHHTFVEHGFGMQNHNTRDCIATIHQRSRALEDFDRMDGFGSHFETMLVAPLLALLTYALIDHHHAIVAQASDYGLRDARTCTNLRQTRMTADGIDEVAAHTTMKVIWRDYGERGRSVTQTLGARDARHNDFVQYRLLHRVDTVVHERTVFVYILRCRRHRQQQHRYK